MTTVKELRGEVVPAGTDKPSPGGRGQRLVPVLFQRQAADVLLCGTSIYLSIFLSQLLFFARKAGRIRVYIFVSRS